MTPRRQHRTRNTSHACHASRSVFLVAALQILFANPTTAQPVSAPMATAEALACAPRLASRDVAPPGRVVGAPDTATRRLFRPGDTVVLSVGRAEGVSVGTQFFTRRVEAPLHPELRAQGVRNLHTSGWLHAVDIDEHSALALVERVCSEVRQGDRLAPFQWPAAITTVLSGSVDYEAPATVLFGANGRTLGATGQLFVIDQGTDQQIARGQRLTIFRTGAKPEDPVAEIGPAVVVLVEASSSTIELIDIRQPVMTGDLVAVHR